MACNVISAQSMAEFLADKNSACAAWNTAVLQGHCFEFILD